MKTFRWIWLALTIGLLGYGFYQAMYVVPTEATMGEVQRIFYYHLPSWFAMSIFFAVNLGASIAYLAFRRSNPLRALSADALALAAAEIGVVFCTVGLVTGSLWARPVWGIWWTWDERLTSTLVLWLIYVSYILLRHFADGEQMRTLAAVLAIFGYIDVPIVYFSTRWWRTQHPGPVIGGGGLDASMWPGLLWNAAAFLAWGIFVVGNRYAIERRRQMAEQRASLKALEATLELTK
jgi:heme exporter protein C